MKTHSSRRKDGFTLVELLVVITIIAVLAAAGFAAGNAAIQKAKKVTALATITGIEQAVNGFYTEYNSMPKSDMNNQDTKVNTSQADGKELVNVLVAYKEDDPVLNSRGIRFLSVKEGKAKKNGLITTGDSPNQKADGLYDPWGGGYYVLLDGDYDEVLKPDVTGAKGTPPTLNGRRVAAWSGGADGVSLNQGQTSDDVKSW